LVTGLAGGLWVALLMAACTFVLAPKTQKHYAAKGGWCRTSLILAAAEGSVN